MRARLEREPVIAIFSEAEAVILRTAAEQLEGVEIKDIPKSGEVYIHPKSGQQISVRKGEIIVELRGGLGILFERASQISSELARSSSKT